MKPRNWRRYWWYRPPPLGPVKLTDGQLLLQADAYTRWLAESRGWTIEEALDHVRQQREAAANQQRQPRDVGLFSEAA